MGGEKSSRYSRNSITYSRIKGYISHYPLLQHINAKVHSIENSPWLSTKQKLHLNQIVKLGYTTSVNLYPF
jgi:hypothetical protein